MEPLQSIVGNARFDEKLELLRCYRRDVDKITALADDVSGQANDLVDLHDVLADHRHRVTTTIERSIKQSTEKWFSNFIRTVDDALDERLVTNRATRSSILEFAMEMEVVGILHRGFGDAVCASSAGVDAVRRRILDELDHLFRATALPLVDGERRAMAAEVDDCRRLATHIDQLTKMISNNRSPAELLRYARTQLGRVAHVASRVALDPWFACRPMSEFCFYLRANETECHGTDAARDLDAWLRTHGRVAHAALVAGAVRMEAVSKLEDESPRWCAMVVSAETDDAVGERELLKPLGFAPFATRGGKLYLSTKRLDDARVVPAVCVLRTLRAMVAHGWLPLGRFGKRFALQIFEGELELLRRKADDVVTELVSIAKDIGVDADEETVDAFAASGAPMDPPPRRRREREAIVGGERLQLDVDDRLGVPPLYARRGSSRFVPITVHLRALGQYVVVHAIFNLVNDAITLAERGATSAVAFDTAVVVDAVRHSTTCTAASEWSRRPTDAVRLATLADGALQQLVCTTAKQLCFEATRANAHARTKGGGVSGWNVHLSPDRDKGANVLHVANCGRDDACIAFLEFAARVKGHLDESWPLPNGAGWRTPGV